MKKGSFCYFCGKYNCMDKTIHGSDDSIDPELPTSIMQHGQFFLNPIRSMRDTPSPQPPPPPPPPHRPQPPPNHSPSGYSITALAFRLGILQDLSFFSCRLHMLSLISFTSLEVLWRRKAPFFQLNTHWRSLYMITAYQHHGQFDMCVQIVIIGGSSGTHFDTHTIWNF